MKRHKRFVQLHTSHIWTPFVRADIDPDKLAQSLPNGITVEQALGYYEGSETWVNNRYQVTIHRQEPVEKHHIGMAWLSIKRRDRQPIRDWREFQRIKNELIGREYEGVELYPAESRKVDSSNQYHMYVVLQEGWRWPFGFGDRLVMDNPGGSAVQRPGAMEGDDVDGV